MRGLKPLKSIVKKKPGKKDPLTHVLSQAYKNQEATRKLRHCLPKSISSKVSISRLHNKQLILTVPGSEWANRLRLHQRTILQHSQTIFKQPVQTIKIRVVRNDRLLPEQSTTQRVLSDSARSSLVTASTMIKDKELGDLFKKLAQSGEPN